MAVETGWLWFWRTRRGTRTKPTTIHKLLLSKQKPACLERLPVDQIIAALKKRFRTLQVQGRAAEVDLPREEAAIEASWHALSFQFTFYGDAERRMEEVAVLMAEFGCPCFDAGSRMMHTITEPPKFLASKEEEESQLRGMVAVLLAAAGAQTRNPEERLKRALDMARTGASAELRPKLKAALLRHADSDDER